MRGFHLTGFQIVGSTNGRACCCTHGTSRRSTNQAPYGRSPQCRSTDDFCVLHLRAVPDIAPVTTVAIRPAMDSAMLDSVRWNRG
jgi:hypothetical protein